MSPSARLVIVGASQPVRCKADFGVKNLGLPLLLLYPKAAPVLHHHLPGDCRKASQTGMVAPASAESVRRHPAASLALLMGSAM